MKTFAFGLFFVFLFGSFCALTPLSFAEGDEEGNMMTLGKSYRIENVIFCEDKDAALLLAQREVEFLKAKKSLKEFYEEISTDTVISECGTIKSIFILSKVIHSYIGYNKSDTMEPLAWCIVEVTGNIPGLKKTLYLFIQSEYIR